VVGPGVEEEFVEQLECVVEAQVARHRAARPRWRASSCSTNCSRTAGQELREHRPRDKMRNYGADRSLDQWGWGRRRKRTHCTGEGRKRCNGVGPVAECNVGWSGLIKLDGSCGGDERSGELGFRRRLDS
jgi:hypothetical protein